MLSRSDKLKRKKINKFLSFIVICVTLSILILPAFTLEKKDDDTNDNKTDESDFSLHISTFFILM